MFDLHQFNFKSILSRCRPSFSCALGKQRSALGLTDWSDLVQLPNLDGGNAAAAQNLVEDGKEVPARDFSGSANRDLSLHSRINRIVNAESRGQTVDHLANI